MYKSQIRIALFAILMTALVPVARSSADEVGNCVAVKSKNIPQATVFFKNNSPVLDGAAKKTLDAMIANLQGLNVVKLKITGFVSAVGPKNRHSVLSSQRAENVETYLSEKGIQVEFITSGNGVTKEKSTSPKARKATITAIVEEKVSTGGIIPDFKLTNSGLLKFEQNKPLSLELISLGEKSREDKVNPVTFTITPPLPEGLVFDSTTGKITGAAKRDTASAVYTVSAVNTCGSKSAKVEIQTLPAPTPTPTTTPVDFVVNPGPSPSPTQTPTECNNDFGNDNKISCQGGNPDRGKG